MTTRAEKVQRLAEIIEREPAPPPPVPGSILWTPCSGMSRKGTKVDHTGEIRIAVEQSGGQVEWQGTDSWVSFKVAKEKYPKIIRDTSHGLCHKCRTE